MSDTDEVDRDQVDWEQLMQFGLGVLGLAPRDFWDMTPQEFTAATTGRFGVARLEPPLDQAVLAALIQRHPDKTISRGGTLHDQ